MKKLKLKIKRRTNPINEHFDHESITKYLLHLNVAEAWNLKAKASNGLADPMCRVYASSVGADAFAHGDRIDKKRTRRLSSRVMKATTHPVWDQSFSLEVAEENYDLMRVWVKSAFH